MNFLNKIEFILLCLNDGKYRVRPITLMWGFFAITTVVFVPLIGIFFAPVSGWVLAALVAGFWLLLAAWKLLRVALAHISFWLSQRELDREPEQSVLTG